jgi:hypothetical protein
MQMIRLLLIRSLAKYVFARWRLTSLALLSYQTTLNLSLKSLWMWCIRVFNSSTVKFKYVNTWLILTSAVKMMQIIGGVSYQTTPLVQVNRTGVTHQEAITYACNASATGFGLPFLPDAQSFTGTSWDPNRWRWSAFNDSFVDVLTFYAARNVTVLLGDNIRSTEWYFFPMNGILAVKLVVAVQGYS